MSQIPRQRRNFSGPEFTNQVNPGKQPTSQQNATGYQNTYPGKQPSGTPSPQHNPTGSQTTYAVRQPSGSPTQQYYPAGAQTSNGSKHAAGAPRPSRQPDPRPTGAQYPHQDNDYRKKQPAGTANRPRDFDNDKYPQQTKEYREKINAERDNQVIGNYEEIIRQLLDANKKLTAQFEEEKKMKQDALSRLSQVAGNKLKDGNPAIADLGDANRPSKLGEKLSSVYTEEWVDAFDQIKLQPAYRKKDKEGEICKLLLHIFVICFKTCKEIAVKQLYQMNLMSWNLTVVLHLDEVEGDPHDPELKAGSVLISPNKESLPPFDKPDTGTHSVNLKNNLGQTIKGGFGNMIPYDHTIHEHIIQQGKEKRKQINPYVIEKIKRKCMDKVQEIETADVKIDNDLQIFVHKCAEISWFLNVQDPPMGVKYELPPGLPIDKDLRQSFTLYSRASNVVDYVVWPAVLLHENGAIITKGVIQGK